MPTEATPGHAWFSTSRALAVTAIFLVALIARAWMPAHLGIGHYDEGVYALSAQGIVHWPEGHLFPGQIRFSPPAWFTTIGVFARATGMAPHAAALGLNVLIGSLTALAVGVMGIAWFGMAAGVAAGLVVAVNPLSIMLSRSGLTDPLFTLFFVLALGAIAEVFRRGGARWIGIAGLLTGAAWNTKYHGWFVGLIGGGTICWVWWHQRRDAGAGRHAREALVRLLAVGAVGLATYLPWAFYMSTGSGSRGLGGIVEYYLTLIGTEWVGNATRHVAMQLFLDGPLARGGLAVAVAVAIGLAAPLRATRLLALLTGLVLLTVLGGGLAPVLALTGWGTAVLLGERHRVAAGLLLAWLGLWVLAAPLYYPYARLLLPMIPAVALVAGRGLVSLIGWTEARVGEQKLTRWNSLALAGVIILVLSVTPSLAPGFGNPWRDATGSEIAATQLAEDIPAGAEFFVTGEPSLEYYLGLTGRKATSLLDGLNVLDTTSNTTYLVVGVYARRAPQRREDLARLGARLDSLTSYPINPTDLRLLDDSSPERARQFLVTPDATFDLVLYRVSASATPAHRTVDADR